MSRFRICGLFSTFRFQLLCKLLHFWCLPRMPFLILRFVVLHTACKIIEVTNRLFVAISDKVVAIWRNWPKHEVGLQQNTVLLPPCQTDTLVLVTFLGFRIQDSGFIIFTNFCLSQKIMYSRALMRFVLSQRPLTRDPDMGVILRRTSKCRSR